MSESRHWAAISESGSTLGMQILLYAYRVGGNVLFKIILFPVIAFYTIFSHNARRCSAQYLKRVFQGTEQKVGYTKVFMHFWQFGLAIIDKFAVWMGRLSRRDVIFHNMELVDGMIKNGQGGLFVISHLGNFEVCNALTESHPDLNLTVLHHTKHAEKFNRMLAKYTDRHSVTLQQVTDVDASLAMQLSESVSAGGFVAIAADRTPVNNRSATISCDFLGAPARFPVGPYVLGAVLSAPIIMLVCIKQQGVYHIHLEQLTDGSKVARKQRAEFIQSSATKYASRLEYYAKQAPLQWFNFFDFWQSA